ncbi:MAG: hypothetical protein ACYTG1_03295 [Planctomycetota bacterium]|jgi:hypothetical protein
MYTRHVLVAAGAFLAFLPAQALHADLLNLPQFVPDTNSAQILVTYDASTDTFTADGFALSIELDGLLPDPDENITGGTFNLIATIDDFGVLTGGTLVIGGTIPNIGANSGTLLTANLTAVGFLNGGGDIFDFALDVTGGDLAGLYGAFGGMVLDAEFATGNGPGFTGDWTADFTNDFFGTGFGFSDTFATVPAPSALVVILGGLVARRRRRRS